MLVEAWLARPGRTRPRWPGRCSRWPSRRRRCAGGASRTLGPAVEHPGDRRARLPLVRSRALPPARPPQLRRGRRRGRRAAAGARAPGSPPWSSPSPTPRCSTVRLRVENAALRRAAAGAGLMRDLVVAGGGPVGLATALYAARAGLDVVVREPRERRDRQGLRRGADARRGRRLRELGVGLDGHADRRHPLRRRRRRRPRRRSAHGPGRGVRRTTLHARAAARPSPTAGVAGRRSGRCARSTDARRPRARRRRAGALPGGRRRAALAGAAAARPRRRRRRAGAPLRPARARRACAPWTSTSSRCTGRAAGEAYVTPVGRRPGRRRGAHATRRPPFDEPARRLPRPGRAAGGRPRSPGCAAPVRCGSASRRRVAGRVLLVGDAAGYVDALTGEGIALGLAQARAAVAAVARRRPAALRARPGAASPGATTC